MTGIGLVLLGAGMVWLAIWLASQFPDDALGRLPAVLAGVGAGLFVDGCVGMILGWYR